MFKAKRKNTYPSYPAHANAPTVILLTALFLIGGYLCYTRSIFVAIVYILLWVISYLIIYAGTCRYCIYYGKRCSVPLEGSCVGFFFKKRDSHFGYRALGWAIIAYIVRIVLPVYILTQQKLFGWGCLYGGIFLAFWIVHLYITGCPNCMNRNCPLNPDYRMS